MLAVDAKSISRSFHNKVVLDGLSLQVAEGDLVVVSGENGSGKTTLLRILATLVEPDKGDALIFGASVRENPNLVREQMAWCPSTDSGFWPRLTGIENLYFFGGLRGLSPRITQQKLNLYREFSPLQKALHTPFYLCSSGMKQSLLLARALIADPKLLLLDEPMRSLDEIGRGQILEFLENIKSTVILTSHHESELKSSRAKFTRIREGKIF